MNNFELELFDDEGDKCSFYTVRWEDADLSETEKFFRKYERDDRFEEAITVLTDFVFRKIAMEAGARREYFRFENLAHALPPSGKYQIGELIIDYGNFPIRLYCLRISLNLVILFNGGEKTSKTAQAGKTSITFREANAFAKRILSALNEKEIFITNSGREFKNYDGNNRMLL